MENVQKAPSRPVTVSDARLASVLDTAADGIIVIDEHARLMVFNKACERMFGYASSEVIGCNVAMLMPPEHADFHDEYVEAYKRTGHRRIIGIGREVRGKRKDGVLFPLDLSVGEAITPEGRQFIGILRDLTARKEAEGKMSELQTDLILMARVSALDEMGAALAHELNQPLTAIILYLQAVDRELRRAQESGHSKEADARRFLILNKALREAQRAGSIIQRIRQLVEKRGPERRPIDFNATIEEAVELTVIGRDRLVRVVRQFMPNLPSVYADPVQIQQLVVNLVRNALEALRGRSGGQITISTALEGRYAILSIKDNGPGIPKEQFRDLFQAFKTGKRSGMGIGLAISRTIVQSHGGELVVEPGGDEEGARFVVRLPLVPLKTRASANKGTGVPDAVTTDENSLRG
jgi:two-component system sensor kinase FixL